MSEDLLKQAAQSFSTSFSTAPHPETVVQALLEAEKTTRKSKPHYSLEQLMGTWRLCFITGTKKTRDKAGIVLGAGRYIPKLIKIQITYSASAQKPPFDAGMIENCVNFGGFKLTLNGLTKFLPDKNILAFDFTRMSIQLLGASLYKGFIRGGEKKEQDFYQERIGNQAFFAYFLVRDDIIAARGKGGGLALWIRQE